MTDRRAILVVGAGLAGARTVEALRSLGHDGPVVLLGDEQDRPYIRPPLSKEYLRGESTREAMYVHAADWYRDNDVDLLTGEHVAAVSLEERVVQLVSGSSLPFDALALTTGASSRALDIPGSDADNVLLLRSRAESDDLRHRLSTASRIAIIGSGWIGLEVAAAAREAKVEVVVVEREPVPIGFLGPELSRVLAARHRDHGVDIRVNADVQRVMLDGNGAAMGLHLGDGSTIEADLVLVAVGAAPNDGIASRAGLETDGGVLTDDALRSSHPDVYAAGDVAKALHPRTGVHERVEHWANAEHQPQVLAASMLGIPASYARLPYFFSDQYELSLQVSGFVKPGEYDEVVTRGDPSSTSFCMFWLRSGRVTAGMAAGDGTPFEEIERLVQQQAVVPRARLADEGTPVPELTQELVLDD